VRFSRHGQDKKKVEAYLLVGRWRNENTGASSLSPVNRDEEPVLSSGQRTVMRREPETNRLEQSADKYPKNP